jgi:hypothetical protein
VPREQRREEYTKVLKHANARQWLAAPGRENVPAPVKVLNAFLAYLHNKHHSKFAATAATALQLYQYSHI